MTIIISWNIQCGIGVDGTVDLERIAKVIKSQGDPDIICLQEVARFDPISDKGQAADQYTILADLFPEHASFFGPAIDHLYPGEANRRQFGNMVLSRLPVVQVFNHLLPQPRPEKPCKNMPRQALEIIVDLESGPLRIATTHLEYHCNKQRYAQAEYLCKAQEEVIANQDYHHIAPQSGPYAALPRPERSIICGDFNAVVGEQTYRLLNSEIPEISEHYIDAWLAFHKGKSHAPTCGIFDPEQWPEGPHCRDFFFITESLVSNVKNVRVDEQTDASDHQPVVLELE
ncbi:endonuclease/exonuclease/phosphatase family protein [Kiloniella majae]|uniref:endonuclease/exonuclease/phosphatase family protein n=1 Tax=Kiloniella majae TaxID=1938558 RepID=UPI000A27851A|nr:endonuclease/exonuclease/phosphatase family protein [Kiloniella majae]